MHMKASWLTSTGMSFVSFTSEQDLLSDKTQSQIFAVPFLLGHPV